MDELFERVISDFHERDLPRLTSRDAALPWLLRKIDAVVGMRRSGKTWFLFQIAAERIAAGQPRESVLYLNFEDERLHPIDVRDLGRMVDAYYRLYPFMRSQQCTMLLDEIQIVPGWERFARRITDTENAHLCVSGSSAKLLSREIATSLRGRAIATEIFPFSFAEALRHQGISAPNPRRVGAAARARLENRLKAYLVEGGFPEAQGLDARLRRRILQDYVDVAMLRDVLERHGITNPVPLRHLIRHLLHSPAGLFSVNKFYGDLRSRGVAVAKNKLHELLDHLTDAFLFFTVPIHAASERARQVNPRKVYAVDTGMVHAVARSPNPQWGHLLETFAFLHLRRLGGHIDYYRTARGHEVDFAVVDEEGRRSLVQVCADLSDRSTRDREMSALGEAMQEQGLDRGTVVTLHEESSLELDAGRVAIVPAWQWALGLKG